ncbi:hypothetical protein TNCV_3759461 [Trichonephila clavipes]|nr:hypothetical protein TNCV_3759461 [Trichonephila clavipes]
MVTSNRHCPMIETLHEPKLNQFLEDNEEAEIWLQRDGATHTAHTSAFTRKHLMALAGMLGILMHVKSCFRWCGVVVGAVRCRLFARKHQCDVNINSPISAPREVT